LNPPVFGGIFVEGLDDLMPLGVVSA